ncbi:MAG: DUF192 domain-containing protein [Candidatus Liptonbacteria bacterium]|nr:DUF192 domain-containing protein [Candidatus Liptonbacteria bacterium]
MNKTVVVILILIALVIILAIASFYLKPFFAESGKKILTVGNQTFEVGIADNALTRAQGLSGKPPLGEREGLFFLFSSAGNYGFWMKGMNFPIDIIWLNGDKIIGFSENLQPQPDKNIFSLPIYYPPGEADKVLEINAGAVAKYNLKVGDIVSLE